jgi:hypothetical protein
MSDAKAYLWTFDRSGFGNTSTFRTCSVGVYQWLPNASGKGLKRSKSIRVTGYVAEIEKLHAKAEELCGLLNQKKVRADDPPEWVQKQYSLPEPAVAKRVAAKDRVIQMAREVLAPALAKHGFRRTGRKFWRNDKKICQLIDLQMSRWGTSDSGSFSVGLGVFWHEVEEVLLNPARKRMPPPEHRCTYRIELGRTAPRLHLSWHVDQATDINQIGKEVLDEVLGHGIPWLEFRSDIRNVSNHMRYTQKEGPGTYIQFESLSSWADVVFLVMQGKRKEAQKKLQSALYGSPNDAAALAVAKRLNIDLSKAKTEWR